MSSTATSPHLFGLSGPRQTKGDEIFGKNTFGDAFPISLTLYMHDQHLNNSSDYRPVYLKHDSGLSGWSAVGQDKVSVPDLLGSGAFPNNIRFEFSEVYDEFNSVTSGGRPESLDIVTVDRRTDEQLRPIEIKLTVVPDHSTKDKSPSDYSCEIVTRPHQWYYVTMSVAQTFSNDKQLLRSHTAPVANKVDWSDTDDVKNNAHSILSTLEGVLDEKEHEQSPLILQAVWRTKGSSPELDQNAFDAFAWSDFALGALAVERAEGAAPYARENDSALRCAAWMVAGLHQYATSGLVDWQDLYTSITLGRQSDKAIQLNGNQTAHYLGSSELQSPRVGRNKVGEIVRGGGLEELSPERRLDAALYFAD